MVLCRRMEVVDGAKTYSSISRLNSNWEPDLNYTDLTWGVRMRRIWRITLKNLAPMTGCTVTGIFGGAPRLG